MKAIKSTAAKRGRRAQHYRTSWDEPINGLARRPSDGRWRIIGTEITFTEPDERRAVARFRAWEQANLSQAGTIIAYPVHRHAQAVMAVRSRAKEVGNVQVTIDRDLTTIVTDRSLRPDQWDWLREQITERPKWVAERVGIEQIGYLISLQKPSPSPTLESVGKLYFDHVQISADWRCKASLFWSEFCASVEAMTTLRDLTQDQVIEYGDRVRKAGQTSTYIRQRFGAVKSILNYPPKRGKWAEDSARAVALCRCLVAPRKSVTDPRPIEPASFNKLLKAADNQLQAMLLLSLNACMYGGEVAALTWTDVDLERRTLQTSRNKTGVVRIAVLWSRTVDALRKLQRTTDAIFVTKGTRMQHNYQTVYLAFDAVRTKLKRLDDVQFSHIRDGAYTSAVEAGVDLQLCNLLAGHRTGISDHYVKRRPQMVAAACKAIEQAYFG